MTPEPLATTLAAPRVTFSETATVAAEIADPGLAALLSPASPGFEPFRALRARLSGALEATSMVDRTIGEERSVSCLGVVSATPREGASAVALGLAAAFAQERERRILLVEVTLRAPALDRALGLTPEPGLAEWLAAPGARPVPLRRVEPWGFLLLSAGAPSLESGELLGSAPFARLLAAARRSFDIVLLDCPSLETLADSVVLRDLIDGFLLVVRARHASRSSIQRALSRLRPGAIHGVVFNDRTEILSRWLDRRRVKR
jgi:Mrp family chromosome partitioning ATPase